MYPDTKSYNESQAPEDREICDGLAREIDRNLIRRKGRLERLR